MSLQKVIAKFTEAGFSGRIFRSMEDVWKAKEAEQPYESLQCPYGGRLRSVHPKVCEWHKAEKDPECKSCKPAGGKGVMKNRSVYWDPSDLFPGEYVPDGRGGWKMKRRQ